VQKAIEAFRKSVELKPDFGPANKQLVYALLNAGQLAPARAVIESFLAQDATSADAIELAEILKGLPKPKTK
jgi:Tfp pilus assembly protein PilF